jgi:hypothetical protein
MSTLTSANSVFALAIANLYPVPQLLQGYAVDDAFTFDDISPTETQMGVDGKLSGGFTPQPTIVSIMLQADSPSCQVFDDWQSMQKSNRDVFVATGLITLSGTGQKYTMQRGFLTSYSPAPGSKKILQPRKFVITFQDVNPAPF